MDKEVTCPWCLEQTAPAMKILERENGTVRERRCASCGKLLAAYLVDEGDFMGAVRKFQN